MFSITQSRLTGATWLRLPANCALHAENAALQQVLVAALEEARSAISSMKVEAETAGQGDEQMMLEACETISSEGLQADMAIRAALASAPQPAPSAAVAVGQEPPGIHALMCVISSLRDTAHFSDGEGGVTDDLRTLRDWALAQAAAKLK